MPSRRKSVVPADPRQWSEKSQRSVSFHFTTQYEDREYKCWSCGKLSVFSAEDQKHTYEVRKAPIDQQRVLCEDCWKTDLEISNDLESCSSEWASKKATLKHDRKFLSRWLKLCVGWGCARPLGTATAGSSATATRGSARCELANTLSGDNLLSRHANLRLRIVADGSLGPSGLWLLRREHRSLRDAVFVHRQSSNARGARTRILRSTWRRALLGVAGGESGLCAKIFRHSNHRLERP